MGNTGQTSPTILNTLNAIIANADLTVDIRVAGVQAYRFVKNKIIFLYRISIIGQTLNYIEQHILDDSPVM